MRTLEVRNVNHALIKGIELIHECAIPGGSRAGECYTVPGPVMTVHSNPTERVLFNAKRGANPFFHFFEGLWMLAGRRDLAFLERLNKRMREFSTDKKTFHGAYGWRWAHWGQFDTLIELLRENPKSRRAVLQIWEAGEDLHAEEGFYKDIPCHTQIYFSLSPCSATIPWDKETEAADGMALNMTTMARSNDMIWGAYGANAVHMSMMHEYLASCLGVKVGNWWQFSNNYHAYRDVFNKIESLWLDPIDDPYESNAVKPYPMFTGNVTRRAWDTDLRMFFEWIDRDLIALPPLYTPFFKDVVMPLYAAHDRYKNETIEHAIETADTCAATDWRYACVEWLKRRKEKRSERGRAKENMRHD